MAQPSRPDTIQETKQYSFSTVSKAAPFWSGYIFFKSRKYGGKEQRHMETYKQMRSRQQKEFEEFPCFFAYSDSQFGRGMESLGLTPGDTDKIFRGDAGMFYRKEDSHKLSAMMDRFDAELRDALEDDQFAENAFAYELANHEYSYTGDPSDAIFALGLAPEDLLQSPRLANALEKAANQIKE
jgi:hypothetical protein